MGLQRSGSDPLRETTANMVTPLCIIMVVMGTRRGQKQTLDSI